MNSPRAVLLLTAIGFLAFGLISLLSPSSVVGPMMVQLQVPMARAEIRAFYGGLEIGLAVFLFLAVKTPRYQEPAALMAAIGLGCVFLARMFGMAIELFLNSTLLFAGAIELIAAAANFWAYRRLRASR
jgi:hypothetical protein